MKADFLNRLKEEVSKEIKKGMEERDIPGVSIAIVDKSGVVWSEGFGYTDRLKSKKVNPNTLFWIGSLSKAYTATAFFRAIQKGLVNLDDPIRKYYPEFSINTTFDKSELDKITFRHLLAHRGGLQHFTQMSDSNGYPLYSFEDYIKKIKDSWQKYPVREAHSYSYSNAGYDLVAYILQKITGMKFEDWMKREVYEPLNMSSSIVGTKSVLENKNWARGHIGERQYSSEILHSPNLGAGAQYSSVMDMANFVKMHLNGGYVNDKQFLAKESLKELYSIPFSEENQFVTIGIGMGVSKSRYGGELLLGFIGDGDGCCALHQFYPNLGIGLLMETNQIRNTVPFLFGMSDLIFSKIIENKLGKIPDDITVNGKFSLPKQTKIDDSILKRLEGKYISRMMNITIELKDGELGFAFRGKDVSLTPHNDTIFSSDTMPYIEFIIDKEGRPIKMKAITADGRLSIFDYDSGPVDKPGPNKEEWKQFMNIYKTQYIDLAPLYTTFYIKNGYLTQFTTIGDKEFRLEEQGEGLFFTADGQNVTFKEDKLYTASYVWEKNEPSIKEIKDLLENDPDNILVCKIGLVDLVQVYKKLNRETDSDAIKELIEKYYPEESNLE